MIVICPKCQNVMTTLDKNGVHIEQCNGCRGIFLDRGELEQIVSAENSFYASAPPPPYTPRSAPPPPPAPPYGAPAPGGHYGDSPRPYRGGHGGHGGHGGYYADSPRPYRGGYPDSPRPYGHGQRRKKSFLESLFD